MTNRKQSHELPVVLTIRVTRKMAKELEALAGAEIKVSAIARQLLREALERRRTT